MADPFPPDEARERRVGAWVSGVVHAALIGAVALGGALFRAPQAPAIRMAPVETMSSVEFEAMAAASRGAGPVGPGSGEGRWDDVLANERMRETHARLRMLASRTEDEDVRAELERICAEMVASPPETPTARLSRRELDVLACVAQGKTNIEAAADMGIGAETVKSYLRSVMRKLDAHTRFEAVNAARRMGVLP